jgi:hypothetical protein
VADALNGKKWPVVVALAGILLAGVTYWGVKFLGEQPSFTYGEPNKTYFDRETAHAGDTVNICFDDIEWFKICPSEAVFNVTCNVSTPSGDRETTLTFQPWRIPIGQRVGKVPHKCRPYKIPEICQPGPLKYSAFARSECLPLAATYTRHRDLDLTVIP